VGDEQGVNVKCEFRPQHIRNRQQPSANHPNHATKASTHSPLSKLQKRGALGRLRAHRQRSGPQQRTATAKHRKAEAAGRRRCRRRLFCRLGSAGARVGAVLLQLLASWGRGRLHLGDPAAGAGAPARAPARAAGWGLLCRRGLGI